MENKLNVCVINDSFPPLLDGIANAVTNYGHIINNELGKATVVTPYYPDCDDSVYDFPVIRFPSINTMPLVGYRAGVPFSAETIGELEKQNFDIIHSHCPIASSMLGRVLRDQIDKPLVFTYHTKYDIDIHNSLRGHLIQENAKRMLVDNVAASDEVWAVSDGAGKNIQSLGYEGDYIVMRNGVDFPVGKSSEQLIKTITSGYDLPENIPLYLFVGRIMWYKGLKIILDAMKALKDSGQDFRMVFIGGGADKSEVVLYSQSLKLDDKVIFCEPIGDRESLRAWYSRANLFLFPSTFDTNGLVVREAAACGLASVLVKGSCAAEETADFRNSIWIDENAKSLFDVLSFIGNDFEKMKKLGEHAQSELYISWNDAVKVAYDRYQIVCEKYKAGGYKKREKLTDQFFQASSDVIGNILEIQDRRQRLQIIARENILELKQEIDAINKNLKEPYEYAKFIRNNLKDNLKEKYKKSIELIIKEHDRYK